MPPGRGRAPSRGPAEPAPRPRVLGRLEGPENPGNPGKRPDPRVLRASLADSLRIAGGCPAVDLAEFSLSPDPPVTRTGHSGRTSHERQEHRFEPQRSQGRRLARRPRCGRCRRRPRHLRYLHRQQHPDRLDHRVGHPLDRRHAAGLHRPGHHEQLRAGRLADPRREPHQRRLLGPRLGHPQLERCHPERPDHGPDQRPAAVGQVLLRALHPERHRVRGGLHLLRHRARARLGPGRHDHDAQQPRVAGRRCHGLPDLRDLAAGLGRQHLPGQVRRAEPDLHGHPAHRLRPLIAVRRPDGDHVMTAVLPVREPGAADQLPPAGDKSFAAGLAGTARHYTGLVAPWLVRGLIGLAVLTFAFLAVGPHVLGYRTMTMLTGSMAPEINPGDVTIVTPIQVSEVTEGMVITYHRPIEDHSLVTHRVISVEKAADGTVTVQTKGDANAAADPWTATLNGDTAYQVRGVVPVLGHVIEALRAPIVAQVLLYGAPALLVGWLLLTIWRPARDAEDEGDDA